MNILLLSPYLPSIDTSACSRKIFDCTRILHQRSHSVYLLSFCSEDDRKRIDAVKPYCAQLYFEYIKDYSHYPSNPVPLRQKVDSLCKEKNIDILQCENAYMSKYVPDDIKVASVLIEHEVLSVSFSERAQLENNLINKIISFTRKIKKHLEEKEWYRKFDKVIVFSENDKDAILKLYNVENIEVIPLGINLKDYPLQQALEKAYDIIFVGNFSHAPNIGAILYFYKKILPLIKNKLPGISLKIVGANPPANIKKLAEMDNIIVTGYVKDVLKHYSNSRISIAPIRYGTGMRYKILEALASRVPVVTTSVGARGIEFKNNIKIADTSKEFADAVIQLLNDPEQCFVLAEDNRKIIEKYYDWNILLDKYESIYYDLLSTD